MLQCKLPLALSLSELIVTSEGLLSPGLGDNLHSGREKIETAIYKTSLMMHVKDSKLSHCVVGDVLAVRVNRSMDASCHQLLKHDFLIDTVIILT